MPPREAQETARHSCSQIRVCIVWAGPWEPAVNNFCAKLRERRAEAERDLAPFQNKITHESKLQIKRFGGGHVKVQNCKRTSATSD